MSMWTHIIASIDVDTYIKSKNLKKDVEKLIKNAPKITGTEGNADIFVNVLSGYSMSTSCDCFRCKYGKTVVYHSEGGFSCDADENYECPYGEYQTRVVITVVGDLRNREKNRTDKEWNSFYNFVSEKINGNNGFHIRNCACTIQGN